MAYLQQMEAMAFFTGFPLMYIFVLFVVGSEKIKNGIQRNLVEGLPYAYALVGLLYGGLQLRNWYPDYSLVHIAQSLKLPYLVLWGLSSVLFWIPIFRKITVLPLLHSLVFFFFLAKDIFLQLINSSVDKNIIRNDMKIYTDSLLLNAGVYALIMLTFFLISSVRKRL